MKEKLTEEYLEKIKNEDFNIRNILTEEDMMEIKKSELITDDSDSDMYHLSEEDRIAAKEFDSLFE